MWLPSGSSKSHFRPRTVKRAIPLVFLPSICIDHADCSCELWSFWPHPHLACTCDGLRHLYSVSVGLWTSIVRHLRMWSLLHYNQHTHKNHSSTYLAYTMNANIRSRFVEYRNFRCQNIFVGRLDHENKTHDSTPGSVSNSRSYIKITSQ
jgi:hypothetical protein